MQVKIITVDEAKKMGLTSNSGADIYRGGGASGKDIVDVVVGKTGTNEVVEVHRLNLKTKEKIIMFEKKEFRDMKKKLKINEYKVDKKDDTTSNPL